MKKILIGIQARSNSTRLPEKAFKMVGDLSIIHRVIYQCTRVAGWIQKEQRDVHAKAMILIPEKDPLRSHVEHRIEVFEGPEQDVLTRYVKAAEYFNADYIVRITGDCAWIDSKIISKCLRDALNKNTDYTSNILVRTFIEGQDTEIMSRKCLDWLDKEAKDPFEREHVTIKLLDVLAKNQKPDLIIHTVMNSYDLSNIKTSIDTQEEYDQSVVLFKELQRKKYQASMFGSVSN